MYRQNYGLGSLMSNPQTTRYGRKYGLSLPMVDYLNAPLPDISGLFAPLAGTTPVVDVPVEDVTEDQILQAIAAQDYYNQINQGGGGDDSDIFNVRPGDPNIRFPDQYSPYAYRRSMAEPGTVAPSPSYFYPPKPGILSMVPYVGAITKAADAISDILPVNPRAIKENELLGAGVALDPIGRVVQTGDYLDPTNVMAGYNAAKITDETVDERIETINESLNKFDKYDPSSSSYDPEATQYQLDKIKALEEFKTDILDPSTEKTKNILQSEYETDPKYQFTGPNVQGDFKTTNNVVDVPGMFSNLTGPSGDPYGGGIGGVQTNFLNSLPEGGAIAMPDYSNVTGIMGPPVEISGPQITGPTIKTPQRLDDELFNITGIDIGNLSEELFGSPKTDTFLDNAYVSAGNIMTDGIMSSSQAQAIAAEEAAARAREEAAARAREEAAARAREEAAARAREEAAAQAARESAIAQEAANREAAREAAAAAAAAAQAAANREAARGQTGGGGGGGGGSSVGGTGSAAAADTSQGQTGYGSCFIAGTKITMADGAIKNIEDIKVGDIIKGHEGNNEVIKLDPTLLGERKLYSFNDNEHYFFTSEHPFMTEEGWKSIKPEKTKERDGIELYNQLKGELKIGDKLVTEKGLIEIKEIKSKEMNDPKMPLYNFNVSNDNSYIADGYVVHNKGGGGGGGGCFLKGTLVTMSDGSKKEIEKIDLGDEVAKGGKVFATGKFLVNNLYDYKGIKVSGSHMVFEEGNWTRVEDSKYGKALGDEEHTVYVFGCENRRILIEDVLFTDYFEVKEQDKLIEDEKEFFDNWKSFARKDSKDNLTIINAA